MTRSKLGTLRNWCLRAAAALLPLVTAGCELYAASPPCPYAGTGDRAPSAGCFAVRDGKLLVVQNGKDRLSPPGGKALENESAQCAAHRETWEETGLSLEPRELLQVFDTGFHLYRCAYTPSSGEIDPPQRFEVQAAFYLAPEDFQSWEWRYPEQGQLLLQTLRKLSAEDDPAGGGTTNRAR